MKERTRNVALAALVVGAALLSARLLRGGHVHPEADGFVPHYLSGRSLFHLVFDPAHTDWGNYQARELSYVFDWIDCEFMARCAAWGWPHFLSLTHFVLAAAVAVMLARFAWRDLRLPAAVGLGLAALWLTSPMAALGGSYYRSAKIVAGAALCLAGIAAWRWFHPRRQNRRDWSSLMLFVVAAAGAGLADRQGCFLVWFMAGWMALRGWIERDGESAWLAGAALSVSAGLSIYTRMLGPYLIQIVTGAPPTMEFMELPWSSLTAGKLSTYCLHAPLVGLRGMGIALGNLPVAILVAAVVGATWWRPPACVQDDPAPARRFAARGWWTLPFVAVGVMYGLMALRQSNVVALLDFQRIYFPLPAAIVAMMMLAVGLHRILAGEGVDRRCVVAGLWLLVASNVISLSEHRSVYLNGTQASFIRAAEAQRAMLRGEISGPPPADATPAVQAILNKMDEMRREKAGVGR